MDELVFQSTLLVRGATKVYRQPETPPQFQSTLLVRGATKSLIMSETYGRISIHAPRERSDLVTSTALRLPILLFQSTLLVRGATESKFLFGVGKNISIHAPRERSD